MIIVFDQYFKKMLKNMENYKFAPYFCYNIWRRGKLERERERDRRKKNVILFDSKGAQLSKFKS
jgi:hypothetical protein